MKLLISSGQFFLGDLLNGKNSSSNAQPSGSNLDWVLVHRPSRLRDQRFWLGRQMFELGKLALPKPWHIVVSTIFLSNMFPNVYFVALGLFDYWYHSSIRTTSKTNLCLLWCLFLSTNGQVMTLCLSPIPVLGISGGYTILRVCTSYGAVWAHDEYDSFWFAILSQCNP